MLIDTHCHLAGGKLRGDVEALLRRAADAGVAAVICAAGDLNEARHSLDLARQYTQVFCTAGVHPHEAKDAPEGYLRQIESILADDQCVALGEIGLDYHYDFSPRDAQRRVFSEQLDLARRLAAPVVIHTREAFDETMAILAQSGVAGGRVVFHSFTGGPGRARHVLDFGATLSFSGIATFKQADDIRAAALLAPADRILVETDAPYLSPEPVRKQKINEPANVVHVARCLGALRGVEPAEFARTTTQNAVRIFGLENERLRLAPV